MLVIYRHLDMALQGRRRLHFARPSLLTSSRSPSAAFQDRPGDETICCQPAIKGQLAKTTCKRLVLTFAQATCWRRTTPRPLTTPHPPPQTSSWRPAAMEFRVVKHDYHRLSFTLAILLSAFMARMIVPSPVCGVYAHSNPQPNIDAPLPSSPWPVLSFLPLETVRVRAQHRMV